MKKIGVVVGRFQTLTLHEGHRYLLDTARGEGRSLMIVIGVSGGVASRIDPMDFETRKVMVQSAYPDAVIVKAQDRASNEVWSDHLDTQIEKHFPSADVVLFGSRDSFITHYRGKYPYQHVPAKFAVSATELRQKATKGVIDSVDFRAGVMHSSTNLTFPTSYQAVDIVIRHSSEDKVIVGRKPGEEGWRFPGGFVDPTDGSLEHAARREAREEVGDIEIAGTKYIRSVRVNDHRYRKSEHKVMTALFSAIYIYGQVKPCDEFEEVRWQDIETLVDNLIEIHRPLGLAYIESIKKP